MSERLTLMIESENNRRARILQANAVSQSERTVSYSKIVNLLMREGLKKYPNNKLSKEDLAKLGL